MSTLTKLAEIIDHHPDDLTGYLKSTYKLCVKKSSPEFINNTDNELLEPGEIGETAPILDETVPTSDNLVLIRYYRDKSDLTDPLVRLCRGIIYDRDERCFRCMAFQAGEDYKTVTKERGVNTSLITEIIDGTMVNVYYHQGTWKLATKGCLDADTSYWSSPTSFGEMFREIWEPDSELLSPECCYSFVLVHPDNQIVTNVTESKLILVHVTNLQTGKTCSPYQGMDQSDLIPKCDIFQLPTQNKVTSVSELEASLAKRTYEFPGYMITYPDGCRTRLDNPKYRKVANLRGNRPDRYHNMLELLKRGDKTSGLVDEYLSYYPEDTEIWEDIEILTRRCVGSLVYYYNRVMKQHQYTLIPTHLRRVIHSLHEVYRKKKADGSETPFRITHRVVKGFFHSLPTYQQNKILKGHGVWINQQDDVDDEYGVID